MEKIRGKYLFQVLDDELEKVALEWHGNNIDDNPNSQGVFRVSSIEIIFRKLLEEYLDQELDKAERRGWKDCENFYGDMREILRPYHREGEDYRTTLKRLLKLTTK